MLVSSKSVLPSTEASPQNEVAEVLAISLATSTRNYLHVPVCLLFLPEDHPDSAYHLISHNHRHGHRKTKLSAPPHHSWQESPRHHVRATLCPTKSTPWRRLTVFRQQHTEEPRRHCHYSGHPHTPHQGWQGWLQGHSSRWSRLQAARAGRASKPLPNVPLSRKDRS